MWLNTVENQSINCIPILVALANAEPAFTAPIDLCIEAATVPALTPLAPNPIKPTNTTIWLQQW